MMNNNHSNNSISPSSSSNVRQPGASVATDAFNPSNPLAGVYSPKTSHLSIGMTHNTLKWYAKIFLQKNCRKFLLGFHCPMTNVYMKVL